MRVYQAKSAFLKATSPNNSENTPHLAHPDVVQLGLLFAGNLLVLGHGMTMATMPKTGRRKQNKKRTLRFIEQTAAELFSEQGYDATSTRQIAERAGIGTGTFFNYFAEKKSLLIRLMGTRLNAVLLDALATLPDSSIEDQLVHLFTKLHQCYEQDRRLSRAFIKEWLFLSANPNVRDTDGAFMIVQAIAELITEAQTRGQVDSETVPLRLAQQIFSAHYFTLVTWLGGTIPSPEARDRQLKDSLATLLTAVRRAA